MLLEAKTAIIYGGGGAIGSAVARAYAREGARVFLAGRAIRALDEARTIRGTGGQAEVAQVDALDRAAVEKHASAVADAAGGIDIAFNATSNEDVQGTPLLDMAYEDFMRHVTTAVTTPVRHRDRRRTAHEAPRLWRHPGYGGRPRGDPVTRRRPRRVDGPGRPLPAAGVRARPVWHPCRLAATSWVTRCCPRPGPRRRRHHAAPSAHTRRGRQRRSILASDWASTMTATEVNITAGAVVD